MGWARKRYQTKKKKQRNMKLLRVTAKESLTVKKAAK